MAQLEIEKGLIHIAEEETPTAISELAEGSSIAEDAFIAEEPTGAEEADPSKRSLRKRSSSEDSLHRIRNRKVMKPRKNTNGPLQFESEKEVKNFYLNINKKVKLKPVMLETIYEKDESLSNDESGAKETGRKTKRTLNICDGLNITKALKEKRKGLIKKHLAGKKKPKKMALAKFMEYFKQKVSDDNGAVVDSV